MKLIRENNMVKDDDTGELVAIIPEGVSPSLVEVMVISPELFKASLDFIREINSGRFRPKITANKLQRIIEKLPTYMVDQFEEQIA